MQWIFSLILKYRNFFSLLVAISLSSWMISLPTPRKVYVAKIFTTTIFYPAQYITHQLKKVRNIWKENQELRKEVALLSVRNAALLEKSRENKRLREMLDFKQKAGYDLVPAEVIAQSPERKTYSFVLNVGSADRIEHNMPVVGIDGVVGKTIAVSGFASHVQILSDPNCRLSVMTQRSRVAGILESEDGIRFKIQVQEYADVKIGDKIITSGLGGIFPKGLKVGRIRLINMDKHNVFKELEIDLYVDFDYLEEVFVLKRKPLWRPDTTQIYRSEK